MKELGRATWGLWLATNVLPLPDDWLEVCVRFEQDREWARLILTGGPDRHSPLTAAERAAAIEDATTVHVNHRRWAQYFGEHCPIKAERPRWRKLAAEMLAEEAWLAWRLRKMIRKQGGSVNAAR